MRLQIYAVIKIGEELVVIKNAGDDKKIAIGSLDSTKFTTTHVLDYSGTIDEQDFINTLTG